MEEIIKLLREKEIKEGVQLKMVSFSNHSGYVSDFSSLDGLIKFFDSEQELIEWLKN